MKKRQITVGKTIDALGGTGKVAEKLGVQPSAVSNWRKAGAFPDRLSLYRDIQALCIAESVPFHEGLFSKQEG